MPLTEKENKQIWATAVLFSVGVVSLLYILFKRGFAKIYLEFSFFNAPIFVGEIFLFFGSIALICYCIKYHSQFKLNHFLVLTYLLWMTFKILTGYHHWGPLAFRHAALFYYPLFGIIGFVFFNREVFTKKAILSLFFIIAAVFTVRYFDPYWTLTLVCLGLILILEVKEKEWVLPLALVLLMVTPYVFLFKTARMMFVANVASALVMMAGVLYLWETRFRIRVAFLIFVLLAVSLGFYKSFVLGEAGRTFSSPKQIMDSFRDIDQQVQIKKKFFKMEPLEVALFHQQEKLEKVAMAKGGALNAEGFKQVVAGQYKLKEPHIFPLPEAKISQEPHILSLPKANVSEEPHVLQMLGEEPSLNNIIFRLFIWRDMFEDWKLHKPLMGIDFGKPFRSPSLEVLGWAEGEWSRDGWIEAHNSYFNIFYRAGLVGLLLIAFMWGALIWFIKEAFIRRSWILILLAAILLNWMVAANFLSILELPYTAIPFWTLSGMAWAYAYKERS